MKIFQNVQITLQGSFLKNGKWIDWLYSLDCSHSFNQIWSDCLTFNSKALESPMQATNKIKVFILSSRGKMILTIFKKKLIFIPEFLSFDWQHRSSIMLVSDIRYCSRNWLSLQSNISGLTIWFQEIDMTYLIWLCKNSFKMSIYSSFRVFLLDLDIWIWTNIHTFKIFTLNSTPMFIWKVILLKYLAKISCLANATDMIKLFLRVIVDKW